MSESRSTGEIAAYNKLAAKLTEVTVNLKKIDHTAMKEGDKKQLMALEAAMMQIARQCRTQTEDPSVLWDKARDAMKTFNDKYNPEHAAAAANAKNPLDVFDMQSIFADESSAPAKKSPPPLPRKSPPPLPTMFVGKPLSDNLPPSPDMLAFLKNEDNKELSGNVINDVASKPDSYVFALVNIMLTEYKRLLNNFIPTAEAGKPRAKACAQLLREFEGVQGILEKSDDADKKKDAIASIPGLLATAAETAREGGKYNLYKRAWTASTFSAAKPSATDIFIYSKKTEDLLSVMIKKLGQGSGLSQSSPKTPSSTNNG